MPYGLAAVSSRSRHMFNTVFNIPSGPGFARSGQHPERQLDGDVLERRYWAAEGLPGIPLLERENPSAFSN
jgi:hypothetical protein